MKSLKPRRPKMQCLKMRWLLRQNGKDHCYFKKAKDCDLKDYSVYQEKVMRHEIIHAFLFESGLSENFTHPEYGHDETYVDWIASQFPKMCEVFKEVGCL